MPTLKPSTGKGSTITLATSSGSVSNIHSIKPGPLTREIVETTHLGTTGGREYFGVELYDGGEYEVDMELDTTQNPAALVITGNQTFTLTRAMRGTSITSQPTVAFDAIWTSWEEQPIENMTLLMVKAKFKVSGDITYTAAT